MIRVCYVDDVSRDRHQYSERLRTQGLSVDVFPPPSPLDVQQLVRNKPDAFLIDYELIKSEVNRDKVNYQGGALANAIREGFPDRPIILLTRRALLSDYKQMGDISFSFDEIIFKGQIESDPKGVRNLLLSLGRGFALLRSKRTRNWRSLVKSLEATPEEADALQKAGPPSDDYTGTHAGHWRVTEAARWIRKVVLEYPGILYDNLSAATALGIDLKSFENPRLQNLFKPARYSGVFAPEQGRWWRGRLYKIGQTIIARAKQTGPANLEFADAYKRTIGKRLAPAVCISSGEKPADWVCYILQKPVKREYSLPYHPDQRPAIMDEARVSFRAVKEDNRVALELIDRENQGLLDKLLKEK
jgi:CheY-like chemotaxis protein